MTGYLYTFNRGAEKSSGGAGWADVWFRGHFAWEYKGHHADLKAAYRQLLQYREAGAEPGAKPTVGSRCFGQTNDRP